MNLYTNLMSKTIDYIEENISAPLTVSGISSQFYLSEYHFDRLFRVLVGQSLKQYVLGRKLTLALARLKDSDDSIIDIAMDFGYEYPEVFSRAFKKQFGVSPKTFRTEKPKVAVVEKASVVPRDMVNYQGGLTLKAVYIQLEPLVLEGVAVDVDISAAGFETVLRKTGEGFMAASQELVHLDHDKFYSLVNCHGDGSSMHAVFFGKAVLAKQPQGQMQRRTVPGGWYAGFTYHGDMLEIRATFVDDLFRWIAQKEIELCANGIGMISVYDKDYLESQSVQILVPVKKQKMS